MVLDEVLNLFDSTIFTLPLNNGLLFNQYNNINMKLDFPDADKIRQENLRNYLRSFPENPSVIVIGEAPGWRGCRFSGVPFTSEFQLCDDSLPFAGKQSSKNNSPYKEGAATIFWKIMNVYHPQFFAWNCIPFHPHKPGAPSTNRTPTTGEIITYLSLLTEIIALVKPNQIVAIGKSAEHALKKADIPSSYIRHPSHGGKNEFRVGMEKLFG